MDNIYLSVIIPAYNEENRISRTLSDINRYLSKKRYSYEILVVNDGSKDRTVEVIKKLEDKIKNLKLIDNIDNNENYGKGYVVKKGMLKAKGDYRLFMDADNSTSIDYLESFFTYFREGFDIVIGSIGVKGSQIIEKSGLHRRILGNLSKYLIRIMAIWEIHDTQRGFKCFTAKAAEDIFVRQTINRYGFDIEILVIAKKLGFKIKELSIKWNNPPGSKVSLFSYVQTLIELIKIKYNLIRRRY